MKKKNNKNINKNINKIPVTVLIDLNEGNDFLIEIKKDKRKFKEGKIYEINIELLEEVNEELWKNLI